LNSHDKFIELYETTYLNGAYGDLEQAPIGILRGFYNGMFDDDYVYKQGAIRLVGML
jgi:hypothetical protein